MGCFMIIWWPIRKFASDIILKRHESACKVRFRCKVFHFFRIDVSVYVCVFVSIKVQENCSCTCGFNNLNLSGFIHQQTDQVTKSLTGVMATEKEQITLVTVFICHLNF